MNWLKNRMKEGSTWAGLGVIAQGLAAVFPLHAVALNGITMIAGGVAVMVKARGAADDLGR